MEVWRERVKVAGVCVCLSLRAHVCLSKGENEHTSTYLINQPQFYNMLQQNVSIFQLISTQKSESTSPAQTLQWDGFKDRSWAFSPPSLSREAQWLEAVDPGSSSSTFTSLCDFELDL